MMDSNTSDEGLNLLLSEDFWKTIYNLLQIRQALKNQWDTNSSISPMVDLGGVTVSLTSPKSANVMQLARPILSESKHEYLA